MRWFRSLSPGWFFIALWVVVAAVMGVIYLLEAG